MNTLHCFEMRIRPLRCSLGLLAFFLLVLPATLVAQRPASGLVSGGGELGFTSGGTPLYGGVVDVAPFASRPALGFILRGQTGTVSNEGFQSLLVAAGPRVRALRSGPFDLSFWAGGAFYRESAPAEDPRDPRAMVGPSGGIDLSLRFGPVRMSTGMLIHRGQFSNESTPNPIAVEGGRFLVGLGW